MWETLRLSAMFALVVGSAMCFGKGWTRQRLARANRDPRIPAHEFNGLNTAHYTPTGQRYVKQSRWYLLGFMLCIAAVMVLGMLGKTL